MDSMDRKAIFTQLAADTQKGELVFPTSARVAMQVQQLVSDPECSLDKAVKLIQAEPLLSARIVATANSVAYNRSGREIADIKSAVTRIGFRTVRSLATALITRQMAGKPKTPEEQHAAAALWEHTAHVAALAHVIARHVTKLDPETALFAGIVHEVGGFYLLSRLTEFPGLLDDDSTDWCEYGEAQVGGALLKVLGVPETVSTAITGFWDGYLALPPTSLVDTLLLAECLAPVPSPLRSPGTGPAATDVGMAAQIEIALDKETLTGILAESREEVESLTAALRF